MVSPVISGLNPVFTVGRYFGLLTTPPSRSLYHGSPPTNNNSLITRSKFFLPFIYSAYVLFSNLTVLAFAIVIFFRELNSEDSNLVEQFLDMVYHSHILITIAVCIHQSRHIPQNMALWEKLEPLFETFENCGNNKGIGRERVVFRQVNNNNKYNNNLPERGVTLFPELSLIQIVSQAENQRKKHRRFITLSKCVTLTYVVVIFVGAVSYFITIAINEETPSISSYLDKAATVYVIEEWCTWWSGVYVIFIGHTMELVWAYGDMLLVSMSLVMCYQFKRFNRIVYKACSSNKYNNHDNTLQLRDIEDLRIFHWEIAKVIKKTNKMLSILTSTVFICNILYLFSRVFNGIEDDLKHESYFINFEAIYAFSYLIGRIFMTAIIATKFSSETTKSSKVLNSWANNSNSETEDLLMDRFCTQVLTSNLAITGNGYFHLNRGFIATLVSALITYEVVILQFSVATRAKQPTASSNSTILLLLNATNDNDTLLE